MKDIPGGTGVVYGVRSTARAVAADDWNAFEQLSLSDDDVHLRFSGRSAAKPMKFARAAPYANYTSPIFPSTGTRCRPNVFDWKSYSDPDYRFDWQLQPAEDLPR